MKQVIIIPARMKGTRLPGKPLILINGTPLIKHVWDRCIQVHDEDKIFIATEDDEIVDFCNRNDMKSKAKLRSFVSKSLTNMC